MALSIAGLRPGDVVLTASGGFWMFWIKLAALLTGKPSLHTHIVVVSHVDPGGTLWGIEARPGGIGWRDMSKWDGKKYAVSNSEQPKTDEQREKIVAGAKALIGMPYDFPALIELGLRTVRADHMWQAKELADGEAPAMLICSSLTDFLYEAVGLDNPGGDKKTRFTTPGDWYEFIEERRWAK